MPMPAIFILAVGAMGLVLVVLAVVVVGIRQEPSQELSRQAPRLIAGFARRLLRLYVRRPDPSVVPGEQRGEPRHTSRDPAR
jgi:hypothetical protein